MDDRGPVATGAGGSAAGSYMAMALAAPGLWASTGAFRARCVDAAGAASIIWALRLLPFFRVEAIAWENFG